MNRFAVTWTTAKSSNKYWCQNAYLRKEEEEEEEEEKEEEEEEEKEEEEEDLLNSGLCRSSWLLGKTERKRKEILVPWLCYRREKNYGAWKWQWNHL